MKEPRETPQEDAMYPLRTSLTALADEWDTRADGITVSVHHPTEAAIVGMYRRHAADLRKLLANA